MEDRQVIEIAGKSANGVIYPFPAESDTTKPSVSIFQKSYFETYNEKHGITSDVGYDAVMLYVKAIELGEGTTSDKIMLGLNQVKNFYGASGLIEFDENGDVSKPMVIKTILESDFFLYKK